MSEPKFVPKPGQTDYSNIRYAPVMNNVITKDGKVLLVQRSSDMRLYPNFWNGISGFLDDHHSIEEKVYEELREELGLYPAHIKSIKRGQVLLQEAPEYRKTWLVVPIRVEVAADDFTLDWEAQNARWFTPAEAAKLDLLPGFIDVLVQFFPDVV
jgi:8-oxo-dGTP pyrophosphatase MutT (NUDIX family)